MTSSWMLDSLIIHICSVCSHLCQKRKIDLLMSLLDFSFRNQYYISILMPLIRTCLSFSLDYIDQYLKEWLNDVERTLAWNDVIILFRNRTERQWYCFLMNVTTDRSTSLKLKNKSSGLRSKSMSWLARNVSSSVHSPNFWRWADKHTISLAVTSHFA